MIRASREAALEGLRDIHGMNGITEGVRQVRGTSCNQVEAVEHVLVTSGTGGPHERAHSRAGRLRLVP